MSPFKVVHYVYVSIDTYSHMMHDFYHAGENNHHVQQHLSAFAALKVPKMIQITDMLILTDL